MAGENSDKENANNEISGLANSRETNAQDHNEVGQIASEEGNPVHIQPGNVTSSGDDEGKPDVQVRGRPFKKGQSGNPKGKPKGALGLKGRLVKALLNESAEDIAKKAVALALSGDLSMIKSCLQWVLSRSDDPVAVEVVPLTTPADCRDAIGHVVDDTLSGAITPNEGKKLIDLIERRRLSFEHFDKEKSFDERRAVFEYSRLTAKYPPGVSRAEDERRANLFYKELHELELPVKHFDQAVWDYQCALRRGTQRWSDDERAAYLAEQMALEGQ